MARRKTRSACVDLEALWRSDLSAFARHLGVALPPQTLRGIRTVEGQEWRAALDFQNPAHVKFDEEARWRYAEEMLWLAAGSEVIERRDADVRSGKIREVRVTMGMNWKAKATANVRASVGLPWRRRVCDLLEHPAVQAGIDADLFPILRDLVKAALADQAEAYKLRDQPDDAPLNARRAREKAINARHARDEASEPPEGMAGIVKQLEGYRDRKNAEGRYKNSRRGGLSTEKNKKARATREGVFEYLDTNKDSLPMYSRRPNQKKIADLLASMDEFSEYEGETLKRWVKEWADERGVGYQSGKTRKPARQG